MRAKTYEVTREKREQARLEILAKGGKERKSQERGVIIYGWIAILIFILGLLVLFIDNQITGILIINISLMIVVLSRLRVVVKNQVMDSDNPTIILLWTTDLRDDLEDKLTKLEEKIDLLKK